MGMKPLSLEEVTDIVEKEPSTLFDFESSFMTTHKSTFGSIVIGIATLQGNEREKNIYHGKWFLSK